MPEEQNHGTDQQPDNAGQADTQQSTGQDTGVGTGGFISPTELSAEDLNDLNMQYAQRMGAEKPAGEDGDPNQQADPSQQPATDDKGKGSGTPEQKTDGQGQAEGGKEGGVAPDDSQQAPKTGEEKSEDGWSEDDIKYMESKGWKELPHNDTTEKMLKSYQEADRTITERSQDLSVTKSSLAEMAVMLQNGDVEGLQTLAKESFGVELPVDVRTEDDRINEIREGYNAIYDAVSPISQELAQIASELNRMQEITPQQASTVVEKIRSYLNDALIDKQSEASGKISEISNRKMAREEARKAVGIPSTTPKTAVYDRWAQTAENMFTTLRKLDPKTDDYINALKEVMVSGKQGEKTAFEVAGIPFAKAFGHSPQLAQAFHQFGKGLVLLKSLSDGSLEKQFYDKFKAEYKPTGEAPKGQPRGNKQGQQSKPLNDAYAKVAVGYMNSGGF